MDLNYNSTYSKTKYNVIYVELHINQFFLSHLSLHSEATFHSHISCMDISLR